MRIQTHHLHKYSYLLKLESMNLSSGYLQLLRGKIYQKVDSSCCPWGGVITLPSSGGVYLSPFDGLMCWCDVSNNHRRDDGTCCHCKVEVVWLRSWSASTPGWALSWKWLDLKLELGGAVSQDSSDCRECESRREQPLQHISEGFGSVIACFFKARESSFIPGIFDASILFPSNESLSLSISQTFTEI